MYKFYKGQKRIIVVGPPASGKTYLAEKLQEKLNFPLIGLDNYIGKRNFQLSRIKCQGKRY